MEASDDILESAKPPRPPRGHDAERRANLLLHVTAVAAVAAAAFTGITAWETHQDRVNTQTIYCSLMSGAEPDQQQGQLFDELDC